MNPRPQQHGYCLYLHLKEQQLWDERELFKSHPFHLFFARVLTSTIKRGLRKRAKAAVKTRQLWQDLVLVVCQKGK
ncbi:MAG TPA: hypothetical protein VFZ67_10195 [Nitrososphaera sp.]